MAEQRASVRQIVEASKAFVRGESPVAGEKRPRMARPAGKDAEGFAAFWRVFPDRGADNPKEPAMVAWRRIVSGDADPERIIEAARGYAEAVERTREPFHLLGRKVALGIPLARVQNRLPAPPRRRKDILTTPRFWLLAAN